MGQTLRQFGVLVVAHTLLEQAVFQQKALFHRDVAGAEGAPVQFALLLPLLEAGVQVHLEKQGVGEVG